MSIETIIKEKDSTQDYRFKDLSRSSALLLSNDIGYVNLYYVISRIVTELNNGASAQQIRLNHMLGSNHSDYSYIQASKGTDDLIKYIKDITRLNENISKTTINVIKTLDNK